MADSDLDIPKVGKVPKKVIIPLAIGLAGFIGWRFWQARQAASTAETSTVADGEFGAVDSSIPGVVGAVSPTNSYGDSGNTSDSGNDPTRFTNNAQWTDYVAGKLQQSETWSYTDIITALGLGLAGRPTTALQQSILRSAIAVGGQPPSGAIIIVSGGDTAPLVAPVVSAPTATPTTISMTWGAVAGADHYTVSRSDGGTYTTTSPSYTVTQLNPNTSYTFKIAAANAAGTAGPSVSVTGKTSAVRLVAPPAPRVTAVTSTGGTATTTGIPGATLYIWAVNGQEVGHTEGKTNNFHGLKPNTSYRITVAGDVDGQQSGPVSPAATLKTKK